MIDESTDDTELAGDDEGVMSLLAAKREQAQTYDTESEESEEEEQSEEESTQQEEESTEDDDPEIDLGDGLKLKRSEAKAGYMKDADYRRKTAEIAEAKRHTEAQQQRIQQERDYHANHLDALIGGLQSQLVGDQAELARLAEENPAEWVRANQAFQQRYANYQKAIAERQQLANLQTQEREQAQAKWRDGERAALQEKLPEWRDAKVKETESRAIGQMLLDMGYSAEELGELFDHRALLVARKAAKWDAHEAALKSAKDKQTNPPPAKPVKPGVPRGDNPQQQTATREALSRLQRSGSVDDAMALLSARRKQN